MVNPLCFLGPQQAAMSSRGKTSPKEELPPQRLSCQPTHLPEVRGAEGRSLARDSQPRFYIWENWGSERQSPQNITQSWPQPRKLVAFPRAEKPGLDQPEAGPPPPLSSSGPLSRHLGDPPKFIDCHSSLESIWCTLLINLFQIIAGNYWLVRRRDAEVASVPLPIQSGFWLSLCPVSRPLSTYLLSSWNRRQMDAVSSRPLPSPLLSGDFHMENWKEGFAQTIVSQTAGSTQSNFRCCKDK